MHTIGIDIGKRQHIAAVCHEGDREARKAVLRFSSDRSGFAELTAWIERQGEISRAVLESSGHYHLNLAAALQRQGVPVAVINPLESVVGQFETAPLPSSRSTSASAACSGPRATPRTRVPSRRWPWSTSHPCATSSPAPSCARRRASR